MLLPYGATAQAGIIVEGDAVVIDYIAVTLEIPTQSYLTDVAPHLDVCSRFQSEDSTAALTTDKFLAQSAFNSPLLLRGAGRFSFLSPRRRAWRLTVLTAQQRWEAISWI